MKERSKGGSLPSDRYFLDLDMDVEWFRNYAEDYLNNPDRTYEQKKEFMRQKIIHTLIDRKLMDWVNDTRNIYLDNDRKYVIKHYLHMFPSALTWVLFGDNSPIDEYHQKIGKRELTDTEKSEVNRLFFLLLNTKIIDDLLYGNFVYQKNCVAIEHEFTTKLTYESLTTYKGKTQRKILEVPIFGGVGVALNERWSSIIKTERESSSKSTRALKEMLNKGEIDDYTFNKLKLIKTIRKYYKQYRKAK